MVPQETNKFKAFLVKVKDVALSWAKAEVAFLAPLLIEWSTGALTRLQEGGNMWIALVAEAVLVWLVPNKTV